MRSNGTVARRSLDHDSCKNQKDSTIIHVAHPAGRTALQYCAVPFPVGSIHDPEELSFVDLSGNLLRWQARVTARWHDGSIRWLNCWWYNALQDTRLCLRDCSAVGAVEMETSTEDSVDKIDSHCTVVDASSIRLGEVHLTLSAEDDSSEQYVHAFDSLEAIDSGPMVFTYRATSSLRDRKGALKLKCFWDFEHRVTDALWSYKVTMRNPNAATHPRGIWELGDRNSVLLRSLRLRFTLRTSQRLDDESEYSDDRRLVYKLSADQSWILGSAPWKLVQISSGCSNEFSAIHYDREGKVTFQESGFRLHQNGEVSTGRQASPSLILSPREEQAVGFHFPRFWQKFPAELHCQTDYVELELAPDAHHSPLEIQPGEQRSTDGVVAFGSLMEVKRHFEQDVEAVRTRVDPRWICNSNAVADWLTPSEDWDSDTLRKYRSLVQQAVTGEGNFFNKRTLVDHFGWRNFGELYADHESVGTAEGTSRISHYNNQYDVLFGFGIHYLVSGDDRFFELFDDQANHTVDIDIYHTNSDLACYNHGLFWHTSHYVDAGLSTHRSYPRGTCGGGPSSGHAYARGLWLHYCMHGDLRSLEAVTEMADWLIAAEDGTQSKYRMLSRAETGLTTASGTADYHGPGRGPGNTVEVMLTAFEATYQSRYLQHAEYIIRRVVHPDDDVDLLNLLDAENRWFYLVTLQAIGRYLEVKIRIDQIDEMFAYAKATLLRYVEWMEKNERPFLTCPEQLEYPTETWAAQDLRKVEVFQWAFRHADEASRDRFLERANWFFEHSVKELQAYPTRSFCRPLALVLTNGYSHGFFQQQARHQEDRKMTPSPQTPRGTYDPKQIFVPQKSIALRRAKIYGIGLGALVAGLIITLATWLRP